MGMEMQRKIRLLAQGREQRCGSSRLQQPGHVLDCDHVRSGRFQLAQQLHIIGQIIFRTRRIAEVTRVADRAFAYLAAFNDCIHGDTHVLDPVQAIEHAEHINAVLGGLMHEIFHHIVGVVRIANAIGAPQQHLQQDVWGALPDLLQALPRVFRQEAHGNIEGRPAPAFQREQLRQAGGIGLGYVDNVMTAHARRQQ